VLKWEKMLQMRADGTAGLKFGALKSIHSLFSDSKWKADEQELHNELLKHDFLDFNSYIINFNDMDLINLS
jgi:hypothetical protein